MPSRKKRRLHRQHNGKTENECMMRDGKPKIGHLVCLRQSAPR
jgi:hypothetical protein